MSPLLLFGISLAGGLGAALRFLTDAACRRRLGTRHPWGTLIVNVVGSFALGLTASGAAGNPTLTALVGTGVLGGFTTFSTASWEALNLLQERRFLGAAGHLVGMAALCASAAALGVALGTLR